jgi:hypothetical protein
MEKTTPAETAAATANALMLNTMNYSFCFSGIEGAPMDRAFDTRDVDETTSGKRDSSCPLPAPLIVPFRHSFPLQSYGAARRHDLE